jgi:hypothetical protein
LLGYGQAGERAAEAPCCALCDANAEADAVGDMDA